MRAAVGRCRSGRTGRIRNPLNWQQFLGFKSLSSRHYSILKPLKFLEFRGLLLFWTRNVSKKCRKSTMTAIQCDTEICRWKCWQTPDPLLQWVLGSCLQDCLVYPVECVQKERLLMIQSNPAFWISALCAVLLSPCVAAGADISQFLLAGVRLGMSPDEASRAASESLQIDESELKPSPAIEDPLIGRPLSNPRSVFHRLQLGPLQV